MIVYKAFKTPLGFYLYDRNTNNILKIDNKDYEILNENNTASEEYTKCLKKFQAKGYLKESVVEEICHPQLPVMKHCLDNRVSQLILQLTQRCNLRCSYCVYSGNYNNRVHSNLDMTFDVAKKAMDFLIEHSTEMEEVTMGFYGGEPLLKFDLIKQCVDYMESKLEGKIIKFSMTTNGTLLTEDIVGYLREHNFQLMISLDGSKKEHDANRVFVNGKGSFDTIMKNIASIRDNHPEFLQKIAFNTVINPKNDYLHVKKYFDTDDIMCHANVGLNIIETMHSKEDVIFTNEFYMARAYDSFKQLMGMINKIDRKSVTRLVSVFEVKTRETYKGYHTPGKIGKRCHHAGPCIPGARRLFVTVNGNFYPCERVSESSPVMNIGNLEDGFDYEKAAAILNIGSITQENCKNCWALTGCSSCATLAEDGEQFCAKKKLENCPKAKFEVMYDLKEICMLKEFGYDFTKEVARI